MVCSPAILIRAIVPLCLRALIIGRISCGNITGKPTSLPIVNAVLLTTVGWTIVESAIHAMENVRRILARNVRLGRQKLQLSQEELAAQADVDRTYISGIERETRNPTITIIAKIAVVLETTAAALLTSHP